MNAAEEILKNSSKYKLYNKFNDNVNLDPYRKYCKNTLSLDRIFEGFNELCYTFAKNLIKLPEILSDETENDDERCRYINFWITDIVRTKSGTHWKGKGNIIRTLTGFLKAEHAISAELTNNKCHFDYNSNIDLDLWKERKDLHDYIRNYNYINVRINSDGNLCKIYFQYFNYINEIHEKYKKECCNGNPSQKCPNLMDLSYFCSDSFFNKLECDVTNGVAAASTIEEKFLGLEVSAERGTSPSVSASLSENYQDINRDIMTNKSDYYAKLGVSLSFLGILSAFLYLYKFTTFGNLIRSKVLKNEMKVKLDEDAQNLTTHELNNFDDNKFTDGYNITYYPS
ncbi:PIR Superfamily Protein [Plasmodium ovale curtisi]|uniref:PIR Superfamily Protein n=1 Tax=Plasmodium ovale curtisi TaxID=864141 RepID=A0A1A8WSZ2_PLAOA|nr:PIR Superfamily Protein [Plasmodium ovale curtisi]SBT01961.1 PIR Superfamily Protein [Plasmodium ovale curtisi]